jgi:hypothetical protein
MKTSLKFIILLISIFLTCNCGMESGENEKKKRFTLKANLPMDFITNQNLGDSLSVVEAKKRADSGEIIIINGFIGGRREPFTAGRASFILGDDSIKTCDEIDTDHCPTPWDACCEDRKKILSSTISIQVIDEHTNLLKGTLKGVKGLQPGRKIKVLGTIDSRSIPSAMLVNAQQIELL